MCEIDRVFNDRSKLREPPSKKLGNALVKQRHKKMIRQLVIESVRRHGIEVDETRGAKDES